MAIEHIVIMKIREEAPELDLRLLFRECEEQLESVPGVVSVSIGSNFRKGNSGYTHAMLIRFRDRTALDGFMPHANHVAAGKRLQEVFSDFIILDYETERG